MSEKAKNTSVQNTMPPSQVLITETKIRWYKNKKSQKQTKSPKKSS